MDVVGHCHLLSEPGKVKETGMSDPSTLDEWKKAVKSIKNSQYNDTDMQVAF